MELHRPFHKVGYPSFGVPEIIFNLAFLVCQYRMYVYIVMSLVVAPHFRRHAQQSCATAIARRSLLHSACGSGNISHVSDFPSVFKCNICEYILHINELFQRLWKIATNERAFVHLCICVFVPFYHKLTRSCVAYKVFISCLLCATIWLR